jgi:hypothetical protein
MNIDQNDHATTTGEPKGTRVVVVIAPGQPPKPQHACEARTVTTHQERQTRPEPEAPPEAH